MKFSLKALIDVATVESYLSHRLEEWRMKEETKQRTNDGFDDCSFFLTT